MYSSYNVLTLSTNKMVLMSVTEKHLLFMFEEMCVQNKPFSKVYSLYVTD